MESDGCPRLQDKGYYYFFISRQVAFPKIFLKGHNVNQGGIGEGSGVIDSLLLFPEADFH
jgi:hypothetical protein